MQFNVLDSTVVEPDSAVKDLSPLAWVHDELRKSLESAAKALKRFIRDADVVTGIDLSSVDKEQLLIAHQHFHQAVGALEIVGLKEPALLIRAMEAAVQKFMQQPEQCTLDATAKIERASFALIEYLQGVLAERPVSAVSLFPQYLDVQMLIQADRIHPADLWAFEWQWLESELVATVEPKDYDNSARALLDQLVLQLMRGKAPLAAQSLSQLSLGFSLRQTDQQPRIFWKIAAACFEAIAHDLLAFDVYVRRVASRVLLQYASLINGKPAISEQLVQDLLFFCAQAVPDIPTNTPVLSAIRSAYRLAQFGPTNYQLVQFGRFDPGLLAQAGKRLTIAKETWSALSAGDISKLKIVIDQFSLVCDSLRKIYPSSYTLVEALTRAIESTVRAAQVPKIGPAMELATAVLYLEAAFEDTNPDDSYLTARMAYLAKRLDGAWAGAESQPLESWMEDLYRWVSDKQTMGNVVGELRVSLDELENALDIFFRDPQDKKSLLTVPGQLSQMRGVFSVLGLDQASQAVLHMRESVEQLLDADIKNDQSVSSVAAFEHLGNNVGALSFLIDMLNYQPVLAKKLFVYDLEKGELTPLMGRNSKTVVASVIGMAAEAPTNSDWFDQDLKSLALEDKVDLASVVLSDRFDERVIQHVTVADQPTLVSSTTLQDAIASVSTTQLTTAVLGLDDFEKNELLNIFLEEAREVVGSGFKALTALASASGDISQLTILRRAFHTLKGSSKMVELKEFGNAAWAFETMVNNWLADQKPASPEFRALCTKALTGLRVWVEDIGSNKASSWSAIAFSQSADAMRLKGVYTPLDFSVELAPSATSADALAESSQMLSVHQLETESPESSLGELASSNTGTAQFFDSTVEEDTPVALLPVALSAQAVKPALETDNIQHNINLHRLLDDSGVPVKLDEAEIIEWSDIDFDRHFPDKFVGSEGLVAIAHNAPLSERVNDEQIKFIGNLKIGIPLYNVYLNEADEWSRCLVTEIAEWALERSQSISDTAIALAHSLAGSSSAVGFIALSDMARALEHALQKSQAHDNNGVHQYGPVFVEASEDIRRLLHQFAAGFLKEPNPRILDNLRELEFVDFANALPAEELAEIEFVNAVLKTQQQGAEPDLESVVSVVESDAEIAGTLPAPLISPISNPIATPITALFSEPVVAPAPTQPVPYLSVAGSTLAAYAYLPPVLAKNSDEDIDAVDAIDPDIFPIFKEEAADLMPQLGGAIRQWSTRPENHGARMEVLRTLHTLKGSARLAGALRLGEMAHSMESEIGYLGSETVAAQEFDSLLNRFDAMQAALEGLSQADSPLFNNVVPLINSAPFAAAASTVSDAVASALLISHDSAVPPPQMMVLLPLRQAAAATTRVRSQLLDRMVSQAGEVMITRSRLEAELSQLRSSLNDMTDNLNRLRLQLRDIELQAETQMQSRLAQAKEVQAGFDPLEFDRFTRVQELTRMMAESVNDVATVQRTLQRTVEATEDDLIAQARQTRELQRDLLRTRMVEFEGISERLYRVVRQASKETGKQVRLDLLGGTIEIDRGLLDRMTPAFEHLLRNCVFHGIEAPQARIQAGKEPVGLITVHLRQEGNDVSVEFSDDGAGLDLVHIRETALKLGVVASTELLSDQEVAELIFLPGFSTATQVTELAGRGIGMDVLRSEVSAVGGRIETSTRPGKGTHFKLVLPLTTAVTQVVMIRADSLSVGVPANVVETVRRLTAAELEQAYKTGTLEVSGETVPFFWSGALLQSSHHSSEVQGKTTPIVIFKSAAQRIVLHVDEVIGTQEVVVKNLGPQLSRLPGLAGMSVLPSGALVLIYNPVALAAIYGQQARAWSASQAELPIFDGSDAELSSPLALLPVAPKLPLILVVDDSITVRRVTQRLLQREGYRVAMAADGLQALERLQEERPAVVLTDIEMPRMDGFDLTRNIRANVRLKDLPIIMITSRIAEKHREHAKELGVDHYLGKPYSEEELMNLVRSYCTAEVASSS